MHFDCSMYNNPNDKLTSNLRANAVPTINLPVPLHGSQSSRKPPKKRSYVTRPDISEECELSFTSGCSGPPSQKLKTSKQIERTDESECSFELDDIPSANHYHVATQTITKEHNCNWKDKHDNLRRKNMILNGRVSRLKSQIRRLKSQNERIKRMEIDKSKCSNDKEHIMIYNENIPQQRFDFIKSQSRYGERGLRGMRWTEADYNLATSIHFQSPATYRFLQTIFGLPGISMLYSRLRGCFPNAGICMKNLENLRHKFASSFELERYCVVSFDGMKIQQSLAPMKGDFISGYIELGDGNRTNAVATELMMFMVRGISTHWKQVIKPFEVLCYVSSYSVHSLNLLLC